MDHHHHHGFDGQQIANTAVGVYAGTRAAQGDWGPLVWALLVTGGLSLTGLIWLAIIVAIIAIPVWLVVSLVRAVQRHSRVSDDDWQRRFELMPGFEWSRENREEREKEQRKQERVAKWRIAHGLDP
jgi:hypothetical protein